MATRRLLVEVVADNEQLVRTFRSSSRETAAFGTNLTRTDRELSRVTRGALAGSGVFTGLGRSIAFASGGFLAFASAGQFIRSSVDAAREAAVTQRQLQTQLKVTGQSWAVYRGRIEETLQAQSRLSGFTADDLEKSLTTITRGTGDVSRALKLNALAADIARGRNTSLAQASLAVGKAAAGSTTALRRLGIELPKGATGAQGLAVAAQKFAGQARAGATEADRFNAVLHNSEVIIGSALLPTLNKYLARLGDWLAKMNESGRLQHDVNTVFHDAGSVLHTLEGLVQGVDKVTGSFVNTLKILAAFKLAAVVTGWMGALEGLAAKWGLVRTAALEATAAERAAALGNIGPGPSNRSSGGSGLPFLPIPTPRLSPAPTPEPIPGPKLPGLGGPLIFGGISDQLKAPSERFIRQPDGSTFVAVTWNGKTTLHQVLPGMGPVIPGPPVISRQLRNLPSGGNIVPGPFQIPGFQPRPSSTTAATSLFGAARPIKQLTQFALTPLENLASAQVALTRGTQDDVAAAKQVVARIRRLIDEGRLKGAALIQALQAEGSALSTIWSSEDAAAQKRAQAAAAAKQRIQQQIENSINPIALQIQVAQDEAAGRSTLRDLVRQRQAARRALASGRLNQQQQLEALNQITSLNQQIKDARTTATQMFVAPAKLQLALAKDAALGGDQTRDLLKLRAAILKFIRTHKHNTAALIDAYGQLEQVNQQLGSTAQSALGLFKQASTRALTAGLGLTEAQRKALRERLSQLGPGGTVPSKGVGAAGFVIGSDDRPIVIHTKTYLDGRQVANNTTRHQQRRRRRNPRQRRGPTAIQDA